MKLIISAILIFLTSCVTAQPGDEKEILQVIRNVFKAMKTNDSTLLKTCFTTRPQTFTVFRNKEGESQLKAGDFQRFVEAVGRPKERTWNEPIWNEQVQIDGDLAAVWTDYAFYLDDQFSHCGVDAFHLVRQKGQWKIFHLTDTRRKENCDIPKEISEKY
ncbi:MAG: nuclear transport factor 2 family protein [Bacteroidota bacterium]